MSKEKEGKDIKLKLVKTVSSKIAEKKKAAKSAKWFANHGPE